MSKRKQGEAPRSKFQRKINGPSGAKSQAAGGSTPRGSKTRHERPQKPSALAAGEWLFGLHPVLAALANPARDFISLAATTAGAAHLPADSRIRPQLMESDAIAHRLPPGAVHQGLALLATPLPEMDLDEACNPGSERRGLVIVLDQVTDPHNVGAILRSAAAFGAKAVIVTERHAPNVTGTLAKAASGALEHVPLVRIVNLARALEQLADMGYFRVGLAEEGAVSLNSVKVDPMTVVVLGAEGTGLRRLTREHCDSLVRLPVSGPISSLNVSNAAAIALYAFSAGSQN